MLLPELDKQKCRDNAREVLKQYRRKARIAGQPLSNLKSPVVTDMPRSDSYGNRVENVYVKGADAAIDLAKIENAVYLLCQTSFETLYYTYMTLDRHPDYAIAGEMGVSLSAFKKYRNEALIEFLEAYEHGKLLCYKKSRFVANS